MTSEWEVKAAAAKAREGKYYDNDNNANTKLTLKVMAKKSLKAIKKIGDTEI